METRVAVRKCVNTDRDRCKPEKDSEISQDEQRKRSRRPADRPYRAIDETLAHKDKEILQV